MTFEADKYRAQLFQVSGLALMTPVGKIYLSLLDIGLKDLTLKFFFYFLTSLFLVYLGIILIMRGFEILEEGK